MPIKTDQEPRVVDFLDEFFVALRAQLESDEVRWEDTWLHRPMKGQEERTHQEYLNYYDQFIHGDQAMPWLKIVGNALICWVREVHPEVRMENREKD